MLCCSSLFSSSSEKEELEKSLFECKEEIAKVLCPELVTR